MTTTNDPTFSIIMPAYGRQEFLNEAVASVVAQSYEDWELIVVDDSSPQPLAVVDDPRIRLHRRSVNGGFSAGFNDGLSQSRGKFVAVLADDDLWSPHRLANAAAAHTQADVVICDSVVIGQTGHSVAVARVDSLSKREFTQKELPQSLCGLSLPRQNCPKMNTEYRASQDLEWAIRLRRNDYSWAHVKSQDFIWRRHSGARHLNGLERRLEASGRLLHEHEDFYDSHPRIKAQRICRIGLMQLRMGRDSDALASAARAFSTRPNKSAIKLMLKVGWRRRRQLFAWQR